MALLCVAAAFFANFPKTICGETTLCILPGEQSLLYRERILSPSTTVLTAIRL